MMPKRIQLKRIKGWKLPDHAKSVARPTKWGNPFNWQDVPAWLHNDKERKSQVVDGFREWLIVGGIDVAIERRDWILEHIGDLRGKDLACWCKPDEPCHADVLLELANRESEATE
jgi:hypothetical protein